MLANHFFSSERDPTSPNGLGGQKIMYPGEIKKGPTSKSLFFSALTVHRGITDRGLTDVKIDALFISMTAEEFLKRVLSLLRFLSCKKF